MIVVGGITRLTDSGLSMVEWRPIMGTLPPLNAAEWQTAFEAYQQYPEYQLKNQGMDVEGIWPSSAGPADWLDIFCAFCPPLGGGPNQKAAGAEAAIGADTRRPAGSDGLVYG